MRRRRSKGRETVRSKRRKKEAEDQEERVERQWDGSSSGSKGY